MFMIHNDGPAIVETSYWDSPVAQAGLFFLSWNAGAARLLVPDTHMEVIEEIRPATEVVITRAPLPDENVDDALELMFEDGSDSPFVIILQAEQCDRLIPETDQGSGFVVSVWTRKGRHLQWPGRYRTADALPFLEPWSSH